MLSEHLQVSISLANFAKTKKQQSLGHHHVLKKRSSMAKHLDCFCRDLFGTFFSAEQILYDSVGPVGNPHHLGKFGWQTIHSQRSNAHNIHILDWRISRFGDLKGRYNMIQSTLVAPSVTHAGSRSARLGLPLCLSAWRVSNLRLSSSKTKYHDF